MKPLLILILVFSIGGLAFSGYLSYHELFATSESAMCTPVGAPGTVLGMPACIYGFFVYLAISVTATLALLRRRVERQR